MTYITALCTDMGRLSSSRMINLNAYICPERSTAKKEILYMYSSILEKGVNLVLS